MFSSKKNSVLSSKLGNLVGRSKTVVTAAVAVTTLGLAGSTFAAPTDITSLTFQTVSGQDYNTPTPVAGAGATYSGYQAPKTYNVDYAGTDDKVTSVTSGGKTYSATGFATKAVVERDGNTAENNDTLWYAGTSTGTTSGSTLNLTGPNFGNSSTSPYTLAFDTNNLLVGSDNLFSNTGNAVGNNTNVARLDILFTGGIKTASSSAFAIMDRGPTTDHDSFGIAAILAVNAQGVPTAYGPLETYKDGTWGNTALNVPYSNEMILRKNDNTASNSLQPSDSTGQAVGGVLIPTTSLGEVANTTIYGYSLFSGAVPSTDTSAQLVAYASLPTADSTSTGGGLDALATVGVLYTSSVPEPTTVALATVATLGLLGRRPRRLSKPDQALIIFLGRRPNRPMVATVAKATVVAPRRLSKPDLTDSGNS